MKYTPVCGPFLASMVFTITMADHAPWDHEAPHEQAPERVVVYTTPITTPTSAFSFFNMTSVTVVASGFPSLVFRV